MFSSNIGFRRRTRSEGSNVLYQEPPSAKYTSATSHRHSLCESTSTAIKRVVLRKHTCESTRTHGLADRLARSEVENIGGFWSRRLSGQKRGAPPSPRQAGSNVAEWRMEAKNRDKIPLSSSDKGKGRANASPRPLPIPPVTPSAQTSIPSLIPPLTLIPSLPEILPKITATIPLVPIEPVAPPPTTVPPRLSSSPSPSLTKSEANNLNNLSASEPARDTGISSSPPLTPAIPDKSRDKLTPKPESKDKDLKELVKEKEKKRFAHLESTLNKLVSGSIGYKKPPSQPAMVTVLSEQCTTLVSPSPLPGILPASIPLPPIPTAAALPPIYRARAHAVQMSRQSAALRRKSTRKRKTGLARIVMELAKGRQVAAVDAEAIHEAAEVREILAQLRQMKAA